MFNFQMNNVLYLHNLIGGAESKEPLKNTFEFIKRVGDIPAMEFTIQATLTNKGLFYRIPASAQDFYFYSFDGVKNKTYNIDSLYASGLTYCGGDRVFFHGDTGYDDGAKRNRVYAFDEEGRYIKTIITPEVSWNWIFTGAAKDFDNNNYIMSFKNNTTYDTNVVFYVLDSDLNIIKTYQQKVTGVSSLLPIIDGQSKIIKGILYAETPSHNNLNKFIVQFNYMNGSVLKSTETKKNHLFVVDTKNEMCYLIHDGLALNKNFTTQSWFPPLNFMNNSTNPPDAREVFVPVQSANSKSYDGVFSTGWGNMISLYGQKSSNAGYLMLGAYHGNIVNARASSTSNIRPLIMLAPDGKTLASIGNQAFNVYRRK